MASSLLLETADILLLETSDSLLLEYSGLTSTAYAVYVDWNADGDFTDAGDEMADSLISYWKLDEVSGTRADSHGSNHLTDNATVTQTVGKIRNAAQFTAANSEYLSVASNSYLQAGDVNFTLAAWVYLDSKGTQRVIVGKHDGVAAATSEYLLSFSNTDDRFMFEIYRTGSTSVKADALGSPSLATWYFIVAWWDGTNINIQVNNGTVNQTAIATGTNITTTPLTIGSTAQPSTYWDGRIDEVGLWDRVLTSAERTTLYAAGSGFAYSDIILEGSADEDISDHLLGFEINRGFDSPLARVAVVGTASIRLSNLTRWYSPPLEANVLPRRQVKIDMESLGGTSTLFRGFLSEIVPAAGVNGPRDVTLECEDAMALLDTHEGDIVLQVGKYAHQIISSVVTAVYTPPGTNYENGPALYPFSGERWTDTEAHGVGFEETTAAQKILDVCTSDWGRFFIDKSGQPTYFNRHHTVVDDSTELTLTDNILVGLGYAKRVGSVYNYAEVTAHPRSVGTANEVIASLESDQVEMIDGSSSRLFVMNFRDPNDTQTAIGGRSAVTPVATTDYLANSNEDGTGTNRTGSVTAAMTAYADRAEVTLTNAHANPVFITFLRVRGLAVRTPEAVTSRGQDPTSITKYQKRKLVINASLMNTSAEAQTLADHLVNVWKDPRDEVGGLGFATEDSDGLGDAARTLELLDRVVVSETQTGLSSQVTRVMKISHQVGRSETGGAVDHLVTLELETAFDPGTPFRLDISQMTLDGTSNHRLIY